MFAATGDSRFKERADYLVKEMKEVQDKNGDGYLGAIDGLREKFAEVAKGNIKSTFFDLNGLWSPWYTLHKTYAGLRDAYRFIGNRTALELEIKFASWAETIMTKLNAEQTQQMLNTEFGGMNEKWDPYTGDYGPNFFGHAFNVATYVIKHPEFGWQSFGGNVRVSGDWVHIQPLDSFRKRVYIAPLGLWLTLDAGTFEGVAINTRSNIVRVTLARADRFTPNARLRVQQPARIERIGTYAPRGNVVNERDAFTIPLGRSVTIIELGHRLHR